MAKEKSIYKGGVKRCLKRFWFSFLCIVMSMVMFLESYNFQIYIDTEMDNTITNGWTSKALSLCLFSNITIAHISSIIYDEHFLLIWNSTKIHRTKSMHKYKGYNGPWIENYWIHTFIEKAKITNFTNLQSIFNIFIPLFVQWVDISGEHEINRKQKHFEFCEEYVFSLFHLFDDRFIYITVSYHDRGIIDWIGKCKYNKTFEYLFHTKYVKQLLILSAGGNGNVAIPLCKQPLNRCVDREKNQFNQQYMIGFIGSVHRGRDKILESIRRNIDDSDTFLYHYYGANWTEEECKCCNFMMTPRGLGRNAFAFCENIEMGNIPVYIWTDYPWIPYKSISDKFSINMKFTKFGFKNRKIFANNMENILTETYNNKTKYNSMKLWIKNNADKYFTYNGILKQIQLFMLYGPNNNNLLQCQNTDWLTIAPGILMG